VAAVIDATVAGTASNSYATVADADAYNATYPQDVDGDLWAELDTDLKNRALIQSTRQFETAVRWYGAASTTTQRLAFPRLGLIYPSTGQAVPSGIIPEELKWAVSEQARIIAQADRAAENTSASQGLKRLKAESVELEWIDRPPGDTGRLQTIAPSAWQYVAGWGAMSQAGQGGPIPLARV